MGDQQSEPSLSVRRILSDTGAAVVGGILGAFVGWMLFPWMLVMVLLTGFGIGWSVTALIPGASFTTWWWAWVLWHGGGLLALAGASIAAGAMMAAGDFVVSGATGTGSVRGRPRVRAAAAVLTWSAAVPGWWLFSRFELSINSGPGPSLEPTSLDALALTVAAVALWFGMRLVKEAPDTEGQLLNDAEQQEGREH